MRTSEPAFEPVYAAVRDRRPITFPYRTVRVRRTPDTAPRAVGDRVAARPVVRRRSRPRPGNAPAARLGQMIAECQAPAVLVGTTLRATLEAALAGAAEADRPAVLPLDGAEALDGRGPTPAGGRDAVAPARPGDLAYVIFTSGSTGTPQGRDGRAARDGQPPLRQDRRPGADGADRVAQTASQCFDISVWQFFAALLVGGGVEVFRDEVAHDPAGLLGARRARRGHGAGGRAVAAGRAARRGRAGGRGRGAGRARRGCAG